jgi:hypothetical protein
MLKSLKFLGALGICILGEIIAYFLLTSSLFAPWLANNPVDTLLHWLKQPVATPRIIWGSALLWIVSSFVVGGWFLWKLRIFERNIKAKTGYDVLRELAVKRDQTTAMLADIVKKQHPPEP